MIPSREVVLAAPVRTAIGTFGGSLKDMPASDLGAVAIGATVERAGLKPEEIGTVVMGNVIQAGSKMNPGRQAAIRAGLPVSVPAMTVNRVCGSGARRSYRRRTKSWPEPSMPRSPAEWRTWIWRRTWLRAVAGVT